MPLRRLFALLLLVTLSGHRAAAHAGDRASDRATSLWANFLEARTITSYKALVRALQECGTPQCRREMRPGDRQAAEPSEAVELRDRYAVDVAVLSFPFLDGGNLEDVLRSVATLSESDPASLISLCSAHRCTDARVRDLVIMLPLSTVDHLSDQRRHLERRLRAFEAVPISRKDARIKKVAISSLRHELATLPVQP